VADADFVNVDLDWWDDLDPFASEITDPVEILIQDTFHMLIESPGSNADDPDRGLGIEDMLSGVANIPVAEAHIAEGLQRDPRIDLAVATITKTGDNAYHLHLDIEYDGHELGLDFTKDASGFARAGGA